MSLPSKHHLSMKLYNSLTGKKQIFKPQNGRVAKIYACGPTVYNFAHIGNFRTYIFEDILRRTIKLTGYKTLQVMNITDIDDKIIKASIESCKKLEDITLPFEKYFFEDFVKLNIEMPEKTPRATEHIAGMIAITQKLIKKGFAYVTDDGSVYFSIAKFKKYGRLARLDAIKQKNATRIEARVTTDEYDKNEIKDFALWKAKKPGEPSWDSPWGPGRPGWHIECSAMSAKYLGDTLDIHAGGVDLVFPHHENEIAQSEAATGKPFARFFMHGEHLLVNKAKMAKSAGNFYTLRDLEKRGYSPLAFRYLCLQTHYRSKMNFTWEALDSAGVALNNLQEICIFNKKNVADTKIKSDKLVNQSKTKEEKEMFSALSDDLNTPKVLAVLWKALKNKNLPIKNKISLINYADRALGLKIYESSLAQNTLSEKIPAEIIKMADKREVFRQNNNYSEADTLRKKIENKGYEISDKPKGYEIIKK